MKNVRILMILLFLINIPLSATVFDLIIKIPTRQRPQQFFMRLNKYYEHLSGEYTCAFLITCDNDDLTMNSDAVRSLLNDTNRYPNLFCYFGNNATKVEAYNNNIADFEKLHDWNVVLVASDDMEPVVHGYDKIIMQCMHETFPDFDGVLNFSDGHFKHDYLNTMPVIGKKYYDRFGYIYFPGYKSLCCDNELTHISRQWGKEKIIDQVIMIHKHPIWNLASYDALYKKNDSYHPLDFELFQARRKNNFR